MNVSDSKSRAPEGRIGVIQGRLSPRPPGKLQAFPRATWRSEFESARELGFDGIEWIYEADGAAENPLVAREGRREIREVVARTGVVVLSVCGDYFMVHRLSEREGAARAIEELRRVVEFASDVGARRILLPLLEEAALDDEEKRAVAAESLTAVADHAKSHVIVLGLEMEIPGPDYRAFVDRVGHPAVRVYYDTGNSTAQGIDVGKDLDFVLDALAAVHVKDRVRGGTSRPLGEGDTNFREFFAKRARRTSPVDVVLQHYFDRPLEDAARSLAFVKEHLQRRKD